LPFPPDETEILVAKLSSRVRNPHEFLTLLEQAPAVLDRLSLAQSVARAIFPWDEWAPWVVDSLVSDLRHDFLIHWMPAGIHPS
jgi:hypothetical protein